ncbi:MAG TPA: heavy metal-associated domain-containing protein [Ignavibacteriales bacterium]|nr:heavy metal-associated domain-containing protein [Ignavibacteriales bacterium]HOL82331.1 heavy metal-associated domain-containing protein [Ignavibacteriales bacterium]HOM66372.1 heavy metal-associated domain-containing protein [Ignavibacteriales bacterium]HPP34535.1 heavy metal-associated domain-containing protein [Ignavibacteriales bacterium]HRR19697.1 heavy metal-associated domain-containing protein [Ignavibacteriales bacterium]
MKTILNTIISFIILSNLYAQDDKQITIKIQGNCNMCKSRIEKALNIPEVKYASWNKRSKNLKIIFSSTITLDSLEKRIALSGHDTPNYQAPDSIYNTLPECCLYRTNKKNH